MGSTTAGNGHHWKDLHTSDGSERAVLKYDDSASFLRSLLNVVSGIRKTYDNRLEHRDIRAGNVLSTDPFGDCGELATTPSRTIIERDVCPDIACAAQFMAVDKLQHLTNQSDCVFQDQPCHDLESIFWVNLHTLYRRAIRSAPTAQKQEALFGTFSNYFGHIEIVDMYSSRLRWLRDLSHVDHQHPETAFPGLSDSVDVNVLRFMREYALVVQDHVWFNKIVPDPAFEAVRTRNVCQRVDLLISWEMVTGLLLVLAEISAPPHNDTVGNDL